MKPIDDATSAFLQSVADGLQRQIGIAPAVEGLTIEDVPDGVTLGAALRIGASTTAIGGRGANLVAAYADLRLAVPQPLLAAAFTELMES